MNMAEKKRKLNEIDTAVVQGETSVKVKQISPPRSLLLIGKTHDGNVQKKLLEVAQWLRTEYPQVVVFAEQHLL